MHKAFRRHVAFAVSVVTSIAISTAVSTQPAGAKPDHDNVTIPSGPTKLKRPAEATEGRVATDRKLSPRLLTDTNKIQSVFVQLSGRSAAEVNTEARNEGRDPSATAKATRERRSQVKKSADSVAAAARKADKGAKQIFAVANGLPGLAIRTNTAGVKALARRSDVVKITPLTRYRLLNSSAVQLTETLKAWQQTGLTGKGIRLGVMDTGIDYTHADFGGPGTVAAFQAADAADTEPGWETAKVVGGWDFSGDDYNADEDGSMPAPDPNPLDCNGHGSHVAGTAAGYGVNANGSTFTGDYRTLTAAALDAMRIGPGTAPKASLYALRVFGCAGSTDLVMPALDWALDPNGDGNFSDHLDVLNMSLGADYDAPDDPESVLINQLALNGVMTVNSAGNAGDFTDAGSAPARALTVASSVDAYNALDGLIVTAPNNLQGTVGGQTSVAYPWVTAPDVSGSVAMPLSAANADGCQPLTGDDAAAVVGKVAWLEWDDNDATRRCGSASRSANVRAAGAIGALFTTSLAEFASGITGDPIIPVFQLSLDATNKLRPAAMAGTLKVTFTGSALTSIPMRDPAAVDTLSSFSSRGTHGAPGVLKPDVAAPGQSIVSVNVGSGAGAASISGTSMATPHVAGIAALLRSKYPSWSVEQIKAAIMNTAVHDIYTERNKGGDIYGPARVGAGRVDAQYAAATQVIAYSKSDPGVVSATFGVVEAPISSSRVTTTKSITLRNVTSSPRTVRLSYSAVVKQSGVSYKVSPGVVRIRAKGTATVRVTMTIEPSKLRRTIDPTMSTTTVSSWTGEGNRQYVSDASGRLLVTPSGKKALRVPVYGAAKPVSLTHAAVGTDVITLKGKGVLQGSGTTAYGSKASLLTLGATSRKLPACALGQTSNCALNATARSSDLRYVGAGYAPESASSPDEGWLWFGVTMWGNAPHLNASETDVAIDVNADGETDYVVAAFTPADSDQPIAVLFDSNGDPISGMSLNFLDGAVDSNSFDNDSFLIPVWAGDIGVEPGSTTYPIRYRAYTFSTQDLDGSVFDSTDWVPFDVVKPAIATDSPLYIDYQGVEIPFSLNTPAAPETTVVNAATPVVSVPGLLIHLGAQTGQRAELVTLRKT